jgi:hypothetical protein
VGEPRQIAKGLAWGACRAATAGAVSRKETVRLLEASQSLAERLRDPYTSGMVELARGMAAFMVGEWAAAYAAHCLAESLFKDKCTGTTWELNTTQTVALWSLSYLGRLSELERRHAALLANAQDRGDLFSITNLNTYISAIVQAAADQPAVARRELHQVKERWSQRGFHIQHHNMTIGKAYLDFYEGEGAAVWDTFSELWPKYRSSFLLWVQQVRIEVFQLWGRSALVKALAASEPGPFLRAARRIARRLAGEKVPSALAHAQFIRAGALHLRGDSSRAAALLDDAAARYAAAEMSLFAAAVRRRLGERKGGAAGEAMVAEADAVMRSQAVRNPLRMAAMYAPGF